MWGALDHNVFVTVGLPIAVVVWLLWLGRTLGLRLPTPSVPRAAWAALGVAIVIFTVVRNIPGVPAFEYLNSFT